MSENFIKLTENSTFAGVLVFILTCIVSYCTWRYRTKKDNEDKAQLLKQVNETDKKRIINQEHKMNEAEQLVYSDVVDFYLKVEKKVMLFSQIYISKDYDLEYRKFNIWQSEFVMKIREKIEKKPRLSDDFCQTTKKFLGTISNTHKLAMVISEQDNSKKSNYITGYCSEIQNEYLKFKQLKSK